MRARDAQDIRDGPNHLDVDAKAWLLGFLRQYKGALLVISHDLELLDESITRVLHLDRASETDVGEIVEYRGTYSQYKRSRSEDEQRRIKKAALQAKEIDRLQTVVDAASPCAAAVSRRASLGSPPQGDERSLLVLTRCGTDHDASPRELGALAPRGMVRGDHCPPA